MSKFKEYYIHLVQLVDDDGNLVMQPVDIQEITDASKKKIAGRYHEDITILASAARTASGQSPDIDCGFAKEVFIVVDVTAVSGTSPTLDIKVTCKDPVSGKHRDLYSFTQFTAIGTQDQHIGPGLETNKGLGSKIRVEYTIGGTDPSFTFSVGAVLKS